MPIGPSVTLADARVPLHIKPNRGSPVSNNAFHGNGSNLPIKHVHIPVLPLASVNHVPAEQISLCEDSDICVIHDMHTYSLSHKGEHNKLESAPLIGTGFASGTCLPLRDRSNTGTHNISQHIHANPIHAVPVAPCLSETPLANPCKTNTVQTIYGYTGNTISF